jgi:hypothetical protein
VLATTVGRSLNLTKQRPVTCPIGPNEFHQMENEYEHRLNEANKIKIYVMSIFVNPFKYQWKERKKERKEERKKN